MLTRNKTLSIKRKQYFEVWADGRAPRESRGPGGFHAERGTTSAFDEVNIEVILKAMDLIANDRSRFNHVLWVLVER